MHARKQLISTALDLYTLVYQGLRGVTPNNDDYRLFAPKHPDTNIKTTSGGLFIWGLRCRVEPAVSGLGCSGPSTFSFHAAGIRLEYSKKALFLSVESGGRSMDAWIEKQKKEHREMVKLVQLSRR